MRGTVEEHLTRLRYEIDECEEFHNSSLDRIEAWYLTDHNDKEAYVEALREVGLEPGKIDLGELEPPHEKFAEHAAEFIKSGISHEWGGRSRMKDEATPDEVGEILVGTGVEALLKAIVLEHDPEYFIDRSEPGNLIGFQACKDRLLAILNDILTDDEKEYCVLGLMVAWEYRNNTVHSGLQRHRFRGHRYIVYHVTEFLFREFFDNRSEVVEYLSRRRKKLNQTLPPEYPLLELR